MKLVYEGKTKSVYDLGDGSYLLKFKDDVTGTDGVFDPGANTVGLSIEGMGVGGLRLTEHFFSELGKLGIPTHFISADVKTGSMTVKPATPFGKGIEFICRFKAVGSFIRRYGAYAVDGQPLDAFVEATLKDDERGDPPITKDALAALDILKPGDYETIKELTRHVSIAVRDDLAKSGLELYDIKLEFGVCDGELTLIDEISGGNMRAYKDGEPVAPLDIVKLVLDA